MEFISKLKRRPEPYRRRVLYVTAPLLTLIIVLFWLASLGSAPAPEEAVVVEEVGPGNLVKTDGSTLWEEIKKSVSGVWEASYTSQ